jgi:hypothetical protein
MCAQSKSLFNVHEKLIITQLGNKFPNFMEPEGPLLC